MTNKTAEERAQTIVYDTKYSIELNDDTDEIFDELLRQMGAKIVLELKAHAAEARRDERQRVCDAIKKGYGDVIGSGRLEDVIIEQLGGSDRE